MHLHVHSSYSLLEGALKIGRLADLAKADSQPALALTDTDNMFGALEFSEKLASSGIQPIVGCALPSISAISRATRAIPVTAAALPAHRAACRREEGYRNLMQLSSRAFLETPANEAPHIEAAWLEGATGGLIALTGGPGGPLDQAIAAGQLDLAQTRALRLRELFGDRLYVELQRHGTAGTSAAPSRS